jgi:hypothetical protein
MSEEPRIPPDIEEVADYIGLERKGTSPIIYRNLIRFLTGLREFTGESWLTTIRPRLRSIASFRTLDEYLEYTLSQGIVKLSDGKVVWNGIPKRKKE